MSNHELKAGALISLAVWLVGWQCCWGQPPNAATPAAHVSHPYQDTNKCLDCHERPLRGDFLGEPSAKVWRESDKHRDAFRLLYLGRDESDVEGSRVKQQFVRRILGFDLREAFADDELTTLSLDENHKSQVATVRLCLNCHATWPQESNHAVVTNEPPVPLEHGVSCQACHGPGLKWTEPHAYPWWRLVTPAGKESLGFRDVRDTAERARLCASCHVGNLAEGKFVTHAWYAGGHPPLPSFEYATFASQMPVHWRPLAEKGQFVGKEADNPPRDRGVEQRAKLRQFLNTDVPEAEVRSSYRAANFPPERFGPHDAFTDLPRLKESLVSGAVVYEAYVALVKEYASAVLDNVGTPRKQVWPEFALYDCAACHHELRSGPGLPQRPFGKHAIGRPPPQVWPAALAKLGVMQAANFDPQAATLPLAKLNQAEQDFELAFTAVPFGKPAEVAVAAGVLQVELTSLIERLTVSRFDVASAKSALMFLTDTSGVETRDYHSARQIAWAIREIAKDRARLPYGSESAASPQFIAIERMFDIAKADEQPADLLVLTLPATQQTGIVEQLRLTLPAMSNFDSKLFAKRLAELHAQLERTSATELPLLPPRTK